MAKAEKQAAKAEKQQLKSAQKAEITALKASGASKQEVKAEKSANKNELKTFVAAQKAPNYVAGSPVSLLSEVSTYAGSPYEAQVQGLLNQAQQNYIDLNIPTVFKAGGRKTGLGLDQLVKYELGQGSQGVNTLIERAQNTVGNTFTEQELQNLGAENLRPVKNSPGMYKWTSGGDSKNIVYFQQNADGTFTGTSADRAVTKDGGLFSSSLGALALGLGGFFLGPAVGGLMGLSGGLGGAVGGGLLGGGASVLGGGKFLPGALSGAMGGFSGGGGFESLFSQAPAPITDASIYTPDVLGTTVSPISPMASGFGNLSEAAFSAADASQLVANFGPQAAEQALIYSGVDPVYAASMVNEAMLGVPTSQIASNISQFAGSPNTIYGVSGAAPITDISVPFDRAAYDEYAGLGGLAKGLGSLGMAGAATLYGLAKDAFGSFKGSGGGGMGNLAGLLNPQQEQMGGPGYAGGAADYNALLSALSAPRVRPLLS